MVSLAFAQATTMNEVGAVSPERERSKAARKVVPVRQFVLQNSVRNVVVQGSVVFSGRP
jgi:hypothetical protein